ncbi:MAG TPA: MFS transporter, partial [Anaerolineales bacterium]|nr:MFS transporter [Anaerolineales bacterium]
MRIRVIRGNKFVSCIVGYNSIAVVQPPVSTHYSLLTTLYSLLSTLNYPMFYLLIEFLDELVFGVGEVAWPLIRDDLHLTYTQIGLLLSAPGILAAFIEPFIGILGDAWRRRALILLGGLLFTISLFLTSA